MKWLHFRVRRHLTVFVHMMSLVTTMTKMKTIDLLNTVWPEPLLCLLWPITLSWLNNHQTILVQIKMAVAMVVVVVIPFMRLILFFSAIALLAALVLLFSWPVVWEKVLRIGSVTLSSVNNHQTIHVQIMVVFSGSGDSLHDQSGDQYHEYKLQNILGALIDMNHLKKFLF